MHTLSEAELHGHKQDDWARGRGKREGRLLFGVKEGGAMCSRASVGSIYRLVWAPVLFYRRVEGRL